MKSGPQQSAAARFFYSAAGKMKTWKVLVVYGLSLARGGMLQFIVNNTELQNNGAGIGWVWVNDRYTPCPHFAVFRQ